MTKNSFLILLLAVAGIGFLLSRTSGDSAELHELTQQESGEVDLEPAERLKQLPVNPSVERANSAPVARDPERVEVAPTQPATPAAAPEGTLEVLVRGPSGPLGNFEVLVITDARFHTAQEFEDPAVADELMRTRGKPRVTSASGIVHIPVAEGWSSLVLGRAEGLWGSLAIPRKATEQQVLELKLDRTLRARVLGPDGTPLGGVEVLVHQLDPLGQRQLRSTVTAPEDGVATFRHAQQLFAQEGGGKSLQFRLRALTREPVTEAIDSSKPDAEIYTLQLPETGRVEVRVLDESARAFPDGGCQVQLGFVAAGELREDSPFARRRGHGLRKPVSDSKVIFEHVEVGLELDAAASRGGSTIETHAYGSGPRRAGESVELEAQFGTDHPILRMQAVDVESTPIAETFFDLTLTTPGTMQLGDRKEHLHADAQGTLILDLEKSQVGSALSLNMVLSDPRSWTARVEVSQALTLGINDLGTVIFQTPELLGSGHCVTETGDLIGGVELALQKVGGDPGEWVDDYNFSLAAARDGSFELADLPPGTLFRLGGSKSGYSSSWHEFKRGQKNMLLVFEREGEISGSVIADAGIPLGRLLVQVLPHPADSESLSSRDRSSPVQATGAFRIGGLTSGLRGLNLSMSRSSAVLLSVPDIQVIAGSKSSDSRLQPLDLRGKLWAHELTLVAPNANAKIQGSLRYAAEGSEELDIQVWGISSVITMLSATPRVDFELLCDGFRPERRTGFSGKEVIQLRRGLPVKLILTGAGQIPDPPLFLSATLQRPPGGFASYGGNIQSFGESREIEIIAPEPGRLVVTWMISKQMGQGGIGTSSVSEPPQYVELLDVGGEQVFEALLSAEERTRIIGVIEGTLDR